ncbi:hypothetical protein RHMOL_Rhmol11G0279500 [Rhododendron molle]|uniref:Uncharacterized protein n=1 Tax=Rhododendron molle TaxID=49168 RepID=A0ACC0LXA7_RHOML|nr:hypothetical protein RHMOL_Rhmol11G0279500 [Rhododendron molle]
MSCWCSIKLPKSRIPASVLLSFRALSTYSRAFIWAKPRLGVIFPSTGWIIAQSSLNLEADFSNLQGCPGIGCHSSIGFGVMVFNPKIGELHVDLKVLWYPTG